MFKALKGDSVTRRGCPGSGEPYLAESCCLWRELRSLCCECGKPQKGVLVRKGMVPSEKTPLTIIRKMQMMGVGAGDGC